MNEWETLCDPIDGVHLHKPIPGGDPCACGGERAAFGLCPNEGRPLVFQFREATPLGESRRVCLTCGEVAP